MEFTLAPAAERDLPAMTAIFDEARAFMKAQGLDQWQNGYPNQADLEEDIALGRAWLLKADGQVFAVAALCFGDEPDYAVIHEGEWATKPPYGTIHRVAVSGRMRGKGAGPRLMAALEERCREAGVAAVRIDTHRHNKPMQAMLARCGYIYRGVIYLVSGSDPGAERLAYDKSL